MNFQSSDRTSVNPIELLHVASDKILALHRAKNAQRWLNINGKLHEQYASVPIVSKFFLQLSTVFIHLSTSCRTAFGKSSIGVHGNPRATRASISDAHFMQFFSKECVRLVFFLSSSHLDSISLEV